MLLYGHQIAKSDQPITAGLYLSKFDKAGLNGLGFDSSRELEEYVPLPAEKQLTGPGGSMPTRSRENRNGNAAVAGAFN
jgi:hypothetical protein